MMDGIIFITLGLATGTRCKARWLIGQGKKVRLKNEESRVYQVELKPDFSGVIGEPVLLLRPPVEMDNQQTEWESRSVTAREINRRWTEGSFTSGATPLIILCTQRITMLGKIMLLAMRQVKAR